MLPITTEAEFRNALAARETEIHAMNDISLTSVTSVSYAVKITGEPGVTLFWFPPNGINRNMFTVTATGELTIESLILDGEGRDGVFAQINGGTFITTDCILRNLGCTGGRKAVRIATSSTNDGGTFIMNGGLITGIKTFEVINCFGGSVIMNNDAAISGNEGSGVLISSVFTEPARRSTLTMTGTSTISDNLGSQAGAGIIWGSDVIMGVNEGDAPSIKGNECPSYGGGLLLAEGSKITLNYGAEISGNSAAKFGGGIVAQNTDVRIRGNSRIIGNTAVENVGGIILTETASAVIEDNAEIAGNSCAGWGGGIHLQNGANLQIKGNVSIHGNKAKDGAGIFINASMVSISEDGQYPLIFENEAEEFGGGVLIAEGSVLNLTGNAHIYDNKAAEGKGIYKLGGLHLSKAPKITDGLFFDKLNEGSSLTTRGAEPAFVFAPIIGDEERQITLEPIVIADILKSGEEEPGAAAINAVYTDKVPTIIDTLENAEIQLELSGHVCPPNVPLVIGEKGQDYQALRESDRASWLIPPEFNEGYDVILNPELNWVLIDIETYKISYYHLFGADNPNPKTYNINSEFPIVLQEPGEREGYIFAGWYDGEGNFITEIPEGTTGDLVLIAFWEKEEKFCVKFDGNAPCVKCILPSICVLKGETVEIPSVIPKKQCHCFKGWNTRPYGDGVDYAPGDLILVMEKDVELYALWMPTCGCNPEDMPVLYCPKKEKC